MNWIENILIIAGISLALFAEMERQGSLVARIDKKQLSVICILVSALQMAALSAGWYLSVLLYKNEMAHDEIFVGLVIAAVIFFCLGMRLMIKAIKNEHISERREDHLNLKRFLRISAITGIYTLLAGIAFGLLGTNLLIMLITIACFTILFLITGAYTGYHLGFEHKTKAYAGGAILLWIAGIDVILRYIT